MNQLLKILYTRFLDRYIRIETVLVIFLIKYINIVGHFAMIKN